MNLQLSDLVSLAHEPPPRPVLVQALAELEQNSSYLEEEQAPVRKLQPCPCPKWNVSA